MADSKILLKRGLVANLNAVTLDYGELVLAYNESKNKIELYAGTGVDNGKVRVNPDVEVPTKTSDLTNDSGFQTASEVGSAIASAISAAGHASFQKANEIPTLETAEDNVLYLVMNNDTGYYDIYAKVENEVVRIDDTSIDLTGYVTTDALNSALEGYVKTTDVDSVLSNSSTNPIQNKAVKDALDNKVDTIPGKGLSTNDYTNDDQTKLSGIEEGANKTIVDEQLSSTSTNPVQNKVINEALSVIDGGTF